MNKKRVLLLISVSLFVMGVIVSCTKKAHSTVKFIHKQSPNGNLAFKMGAIEVANEDFTQDIRFEIFQKEMDLYNLKIGRVKAILMEKLIDQDPKKKELTNDEYLEKYITNKVTVTSKEVEDFANENKIPHLDESLKERINAYLMNDKKKEAISAWLDGQFEKTPVEIYFERPERPVFSVLPGDSPFTGGERAKVTIVEFSDFQCPFCQQAMEKLNQLKEKYGRKIKIVFKNFPLPSHPNAPGAARAGLCAQQLKGNGAFWQLHDKMFANQSALERDSLVQYAVDLKLDKNAFETCLDSHEIRMKVEVDLQQGKDLGVRSTPTFYVNGMPVQGNQKLDVFVELIDEQLLKN